MRLPFVSRLAFDLLVAERDRLIAEKAALTAQCERLTDAATRITRREAGMPEVPRGPRPAMEPMPRELHAYFEGFADKRMGRTQRSEAYRRHAGGQDWDRITRDAMPKPEEPDDGAP